MSNLNLTIYRQYYDEIKSGKKKFEYRDMTEYYAKRLLVSGKLPEKGEIIKAKHYDTVTFYCKTAPAMKVKWEGLFLYPKTNPKWFAIKLGEIVND